jgi:predicted nucleotidyltransferase
MKPSEALKIHREAIRELVTHFPVANPRVFGSVLHGTDKDGSDVDILVDDLPGTSLFDLGGLQYQLEELLGVPVDLLTPTDLPIKFREQVIAEASPV